MAKVIRFLLALQVALMLVALFLAVWTLVFLLVFLAEERAAAQGESHIIGLGRVAATDQEAQECYFAIGQTVSFNYDPNRAPEWCALARSKLLGKTVRLVAFVEE